MPKIYGYILVSDGLRPGHNIHACERARPQLAALRRVGAELGIPLPLRHDYKRKVLRLNDLPVLGQTLRELEAMGSGLVVVECLARLLQKPPFEVRHIFLDDLMKHKSRLFGAMQKRRLDFYDMQGLLQLLSVAPRKRRTTEPRNRPKHTRDTQPAVTASSAAREARSEEHTRLLAQIRQELIDQGQPATLKAIAAVANARGYCNQKNNEWTVAAVSVRLKPLRAASVTCAPGPEVVSKTISDEQ